MNLIIFVIFLLSKMVPTKETVSKVTIEKCNYANIVLPGKGNVTIEKYLMKNGFLSVELITYGSTITSIKFPNKNGEITDVVLGFDNINGYLGRLNPYAGATVGRVANRISKGTFTIDGETFHVSTNIGENTLHGGVQGFDKKLWYAYKQHDSVVMAYESEHLEEGFPGNLLVEVKYTLTNNNELIINYKAKTDRPTPVNIVNHSYFNLAGADKKSAGLFEHLVQINADSYTPLFENILIPTGEIASVEGTPYDLRNLSRLGDKIKSTINSTGFDINYAVNGEGFRPVATLIHPSSGRKMEVFSDQPGVQFYTSNSIESIPGRNGVTYEKFNAACFETQNFPDAVNHEGVFPPSVLRPGELYYHNLCFKFSLSEV